MPGLLKPSAETARVAGPLPPLSVRAFGSALFTGYLPTASGTAGSALGLLLYLIPGCESPAILGPMILVCLVLGAAAASAMERSYGHDPSVVTIDEVVGMWISLLLLPKRPLVLAASFVAFRVFDILKPWPARFIDRRPGGWSVMLDDVVAGVYANIAVRIIFAFI